MEVQNFNHLVQSTVKSLNIEKINSKIDNDGFCILNNLLSDETINQLKVFWSKEFKKQLSEKPNINSVRGNLHLGEQDFESYSDNAEWNIFRSFSFYWNKNCYLSCIP